MVQAGLIAASNSPLDRQSLPPSREYPFGVATLLLALTLSMPIGGHTFFVKSASRAVTVAREVAQSLCCACLRVHPIRAAAEFALVPLLRKGGFAWVPVRDL